MIAGHGDIAKALKSVDRKDILFFASGVSNSQETDENEYTREEELLWNQDRDKRVVYFSSLSVFYSDTRYVRHKLFMERCAKAWFDEWTIIRLGNISWGDNPHTLINYFKNNYKLGKKLIVQDVYRYVIDKPEFLHWMKMIPNWNCEMNIPGLRLKVDEIVDQYVK